MDWRKRPDLASAYCYSYSPSDIGGKRLVGGYCEVRGKRLNGEKRERVCVRVCVREIASQCV